MTSLILQSPSSAPSKALRLEGDWYVRHSTRAIWQGKRNVQVNGSHDEGSLPSETLSYSYQERTGSEIKTRVEEGWKVLGQGKDGKLASWTRETEWGIEDSAGETRGDWRAQWMVIFFPPTSLPLAPEGYDILCDRQGEVTDETLVEIRVALDHPGGPDEELGRLKILPVLGDGARNKEMQEKEEARYKAWEQRTGPAAGISPDLTYDEEEPGHGSKCTVQ